MVRFLHWPALHELRDEDELPYAWGSLQLLEGGVPPYKFAPAGPQTWVGWLYEGVISLTHLALPDAVERGAPLQVRPFLAVNHALFDAYRDSGALRQVWVVISFLCAMGAVVAGFRLGLAKAGLAGAILLGGTAALLPLFVGFSVQARPYMAGWGFGMMALYYALASRHPKSPTISAVLMGLSIGSRVDMLMLLPIVWSETYARSRGRQRLNNMFYYHSVLLITFLAVAPWFLMTLVGCLRIIGTVRISTVGEVVAGPVAVLRAITWQQGLLLHVLFFLFAIALWIVCRPRRVFLATYILLAGLSMLKGTAFGLRHQGAPLILVIVTGVYAIDWVRQRSPSLALVLGLTALVLPAWQTQRLVMASRRQYVPELATQWVEKHVPAGTIVYLQPSIRNLLPTAISADATWSEVTDNAAWRRKFESGLRRFDLRAGEIPRALSEENMLVERGDRRGLFILGSRLWIDAPRYDIRVYKLGPVFGVRDLPAAFKQTGGVIILRTEADDPDVISLGSPTVAWLDTAGRGTRIYCSADVARHLR
ncbi:MAG TPA: hypothetical protein VL486_11840 [Verrucomicrobiae bacterium]|nr:hypothetical protein [Verrucomicrobiae bacterium]